MTNSGKGVLRMGTSGIAVPGNKQSFPEEFKDKSRLNYYSSLFNTLEVNSTFKTIPKLSTLHRWSLDVPADFQFTVKLWKQLTHVKPLTVNPQDVETFFRVISQLDKKGCLLIQFPASITSTYYPQVEQLLQQVEASDTGNAWRKAVEFRSTTWYDFQTPELLRCHKACMVLHDMPASANFELNESTDFVYYRFHGPTGNYRGSYSNGFLKEHALAIHSLLSSGRDVYVYFNNTMGSAYENAKSLKEMVLEFE